MTKPDSTFAFKEFSVEDVYKTILELNNSPCLDVYGINARIIKLASPYICEPLTHIFNSCLNVNVFPKLFKYTKVIPIFKKGDKDDYDNYRPISIIPIVSKVFEVLLNKQIVNYFGEIFSLPSAFASAWSWFLTATTCCPAWAVCGTLEVPFRLSRLVAINKWFK